jgi:agmatine/peptidylarginine deiminase
MPMTEFEALRIIGARPALQIDNERDQRIADWPFMVWGPR